MPNPETTATIEKFHSNSEAAAERSAELSITKEKAAESKSERAGRIEKARKATREAINNKDHLAGESKKDNAPSIIRSKATNKQKEATYKSTLDTIRHGMNPASKLFSKLIHSNVVESASNLIGSTIAKPRFIIAGSFMALVLTSALYLIAKRFGFSLSGSETMLSFAIGWVIGLIYELIRSIFKSSD